MKRNFLLETMHPDYERVNPYWKVVYKQSGKVLGIEKEENYWLNKNSDNIHANHYSILDELRHYQTHDGKYHFRLSWADQADSQEWIQTSNPVESETVEGYEEVDISHTVHGWNGLQYTFL